ncbi:MAG: hypothetical protein WCQ95_04870 [Bacteroidota bacterium]
MRRFFVWVIACVLTFSSCIFHSDNNKFGRDFNDARIRLGLPIIKKGWQRHTTPFYGPPRNSTLWFTDSRPKDLKQAYYAYKTIYYDENGPVAEADRYLNMEFNWFEPKLKSHGVISDSMLTLLKKCHALDIIYVLRCVNLDGEDFSRYTPGWNCRVMGQLNGYAYQETISMPMAQEMLKHWHVRRLNY